MILYLNAFGFKKTQRFLSYRLFQKVTLVALLFYSAAKTYSHWLAFHLFHNQFEARVYNLIAIIVCVSMILVLLTVVSYLPKFGDVANPANNEVTKLWYFLIFLRFQLQ